MTDINKLKVATIVGTRPELIKLSRVIVELDRVTEHVLVHTGQNYDDELNRVFFDDLEIRSSTFKDNLANGSPEGIWGGRHFIAFSIVVMCSWIISIRVPKESAPTGHASTQERS